MSQDTASSAESKTEIKRHVAYKARISDILNGEYIRGDGWEPNYVLSLGRKMSRVNVIGVVVSRTGEPDMRAMNLDDGTGIIPLRTFADDKILDKADIGDIVLVIGRPRSYGEEKYIVPEIIKRLQDQKWIELRVLELGKKANETEEAKTESVVMEDEGDSASSRIYELIKKLDDGSGVDIDDVISKSGVNEAEQTIQNLLREGDIFEVKAGRIKVLE